jgi:hypothetical protein
LEYDRRAYRALPAADKAIPGPHCDGLLFFRLAVSNAPLWLMNATLPGRAMPAAKLAFRADRGHITPRQFGPITGMRPRSK